ncbi:hypothetical protein HY004_01695 [Candidatus Saccharibacteria bacterium]|nr:hypothetical protein [Candidatus Saccharibacteria bacterium]
MNKEPTPISSHVGQLARWAKETSKASSDIGLIRHQETTGSNRYDTARLHAANASHLAVAKSALEQACRECPFADMCSAEGNTERISRGFPTAKERNELVKRAKKGEACSASWLTRPEDDGSTVSPDDQGTT